MLSLLPVAIALLAVQLNYKTAARTNRLDFAVVLALISVAPLAATYNDLCRMAGASANTSIAALFGQLGISWYEFFYIWMALFAGPFFTRLCRRLVDAGMSRRWAVVGLVPYINLPLFLYLCFRPSSDITVPTGSSPS